MRAARQFLLDLEDKHLFDKTAQVVAQLYGSLALTGKGHGTDRAVLLGLEGETPDEVDPDSIERRLAHIRSSGRIKLLGKREIAFDEPLNLLFHRIRCCPNIPTACDSRPWTPVSKTLFTEEFYSIGGGFIIRGSR